MNLKYLKLYEAFSSSKLSKTLSYLKPEGKKVFLDLIKDIGKLYNFPISELSDSDFQYLPYKKAFNLFKESENKPSLIKFWFSAEGNFIKSTYSESYNKKTNTNFSRDQKDYTPVRNIELKDLEELSEGSIILLNCSKGIEVSYLFKPKGENYKYYLLQDGLDGTEPRRAQWSDIAKNSWCIDNTGDYRSMVLLEPKLTKNSMDYQDPDIQFINCDFTVKNYAKDMYNRQIEVSPSSQYWARREPKVNLNGFRTEVDTLKDANFALILDLDNFRSTTHTNLSELITKREEQKKGAFDSPDKIKSENIDRYINKILGKELTSDIMPVYIKRLVGYDKILFIKENVKLEKKIDKIIDRYTNLLVAGSKKKANDVIKYLRKTCIETLNANKLYVKNMSEIKEKLKQEGNTKSLEILNTLEDLSGFIYKKLNIDKVENVYDLEVLLGKISTIDDLLNSKRNGIDIIKKYFLKHCMSMSGELTRTSAYRTIAEDRYLPDINVFREGVARIKTIVSKW